jgi:hypothetical protein
MGSVEQQETGNPVGVLDGQPNMTRSQRHIRRVVSRILSSGKSSVAPFRLDEDDGKCCYGISRPCEGED